MFVYVISKKGEPLMPCKPAIARLLLKEGKARVKSRCPFTIKMLVDTTEFRQEVICGIDSGSKVVGSAATTNGNVVYQAEVQLRQDVSKKLTQRAMYRRTRRGRKCRYRPARWLNRASSYKIDRLAPSIRSKLDSHLREIRQVKSLLPVSKLKIETASFDIHKITNPGVEGKGYQKGSKKGFYNLKAYILHRDNYECNSGRKIKHASKLHVHHIKFRSNGGTDTPSNLITLCETCHSDLHSGVFALKSKRSKTKHATEIGIIKSQLKKVCEFTETFGYETKFKREQCLHLPKTHANDAIAVCCEDGELVNTLGNIFYKRHVSSGDYQQTKGSRSEKKMPTGKLFGLRKFDLIQTSKGVGFIKGKRTRGFFALMDIFNNTLTTSVNVKKNCIRLRARSTTLIEESRDMAVA